MAPVCIARRRLAPSACTRCRGRPSASVARRRLTAMSSKQRRLWKTGWLTPLNPSKLNEGTGREFSRALRVSALANSHNREHPPGLFFVAPVRVELAVTHRADSGYIDSVGLHPADFKLSTVR